MALITCYECDRMASDLAAACPYCGAPVAKHSSSAQAQTIAPVARGVGFWLGIGIFLFPMIFVWILVRQGYSNSIRVIGFCWLGLVSMASLSACRAAYVLT